MFRDLESEIQTFSSPHVQCVEVKVEFCETFSWRSIPRNLLTAYVFMVNLLLFYHAHFPWYGHWSNCVVLHT